MPLGDSLPCGMLSSENLLNQIIRTLAGPLAIPYGSPIAMQRRIYWGGPLSAGTMKRLQADARDAEDSVTERSPLISLPWCIELPLS